MKGLRGQEIAIHWRNVRVVQSVYSVLHPTGMPCSLYSGERKFMGRNNSDGPASADG
jgi:hypothetical protein